METTAWRTLNRSTEIPVTGTPIVYDTLQVYLNGRAITETTKDGAGYVLRGDRLFGCGRSTPSRLSRFRFHLFIVETSGDETSPIIDPSTHVAEHEAVHEVCSQWRGGGVSLTWRPAVRERGIPTNSRGLCWCGDTGLPSAFGASYALEWLDQLRLFFEAAGPGR